MTRDIYAPIDLNGNVITGLAAGVSAADAVNVSQLGSHTHASQEYGQWRYASSAVMSDPGQGYLRTNGVDSFTSTEVAISTLTESHIDAGGVLSQLAVGDTIHAQVRTDSTNWAKFVINAPITNNGTWYLIPTAQTASNGPTISKNTDLLVMFTYGTGGGGSGANSDEVLVQNSEPTPQFGMDLWVDPDAPDWPGGGGGGGGATDLNGLTDVDTATTPPVSGQVLKWNGSQWVPAADSTGGGGGTPADAAPPAVGASSVLGVSTDYAREDHTHAGAALSHTHAQGDITNLTGDLALKAPLASPVFTTDVQVNGNVQAGANGDVVDRYLRVNGGPGTFRGISMRTNGSARWTLGAGNQAEGGGNAGSNLTVYRWNDAGAVIGTPLQISRATGLATVSGDPTDPLGIVTKQYVDAGLGANAPLASPALTGVPTAPTAAVDTNTTQLATTAFVVGQAGAVNGSALGAAAPGTSLRYARADHIHPTTGLALSGHTHTQAESHNSPDTDASPTALHHTIGAGANQAAAGNHTHATPTLDHGANLVGLADDDHPQYGLIVVSAAQPGSPRVGTIWVPAG